MPDKEKIDAMESNEVTIKVCHSYDNFVSEVRASRWKSRIFRGQRDPKWPLRSIWDRQRKLLRDGIDIGDGRFKERTGENLDRLFGGPENSIRARDRHRELFAEYLRDLPDVPDEFLDDPIKTWALGRHFGLATPLLD